MGAELQKPLALAIIGGMFLGTLVANNLNENDNPVLMLVKLKE